MLYLIGMVNPKPLGSGDKPQVMGLGMDDYVHLTPNV